MSKEATLVFLSPTRRAKILCCIWTRPGLWVLEKILFLGYKKQECSFALIDSNVVIAVRWIQERPSKSMGDSSHSNDLGMHRHITI